MRSKGIIDQAVAILILQRYLERGEPALNSCSSALRFWPAMPP
jgi:hypothetical protein